MRTNSALIGAAAATAILFGAAPAMAQQNFDDVEIRAEQIKPGIAVLFGAGGNIGVSYGDDGTILIDDQYAPLTDKIVAAIEALGASPVKFLVNTHWHGDHSGGNENFGEAGAVIFAHDNVRVRMASGGNIFGNDIPASPDIALPVVTYAKGITFHQNGDTVDVLHTAGGHTDGDSIIHWVEDNVVHMGDLYFNIAGFPFIDTSSGGNILHAIESIDAALELMDESTVVIPGHGPVSNRAELAAYRDRLAATVAAVRPLVDEGLSVEQIVARKPLAEFAPEGGGGFINQDQFVQFIVASLAMHEAKPHSH